MLKSSFTAACGDAGSQPPYHGNPPTSAAGGPTVRSSSAVLNDPRAELRGGRRLSARSEPADVASAISYGLVRELAQAQIRRECRRLDFNWDAFLADRPEWAITEIVHRRAVQQERTRGLECRPTDIPTDVVLGVVRDVIAEWTGQRDLRPTEAGFCEEQARRGEKGRETQLELASCRETQVLALVADGISNGAEIGRRLGMDRSTVSRIRRDADATASAALQEVGDVAAVSPAFPAPEIPVSERWPVVQFNRWTGIVLSISDCHWLADVGRCYEAEGQEADLMHQIQMSAGAANPWAYLQRCVANRCDSWTVNPQLLADVLVWAGEKSLMYSLMAIGGGYVKRPLPYLREVLAKAVRKGGGRSGSWERPLAMSVGMARQWAPELVIVDADEAIADEHVEQGTGHIESFRRRFGRLPWETEPILENTADLDTADADFCCIGLKGIQGDDSYSQSLESRDIASSGGICKADATPAPEKEPDLGRTTGGRNKPAGNIVAVDQGMILGRLLWEREKSEQPVKTVDVPDPDNVRGPENHTEVRKSVQVTTDPLPAEKNPRVLEQVPCRHPVAALLTAVMVLDDVALVGCSAGCGHQVYSDRGPVECPCHWEPVKVAQVTRALRVYQIPDALRG